MSRAALAPLPISVYGDLGVLHLGNGGVALIDAADAEFVGRWRWVSKLHDGVHLYVVRGRLKSDGPGAHFVYLHRELMRPGPGLVVDHRDGNGLDCTRANMRNCTEAENLRNRRGLKVTKTGLKGVTKNRKGSRYTAAIMVSGRKIRLGSFATKELAHAAYVAAALEHHGEFARAA